MANTVQTTKLSAAQRAANFNLYTRKHMQPLPAVSGAASSSISITIPKVRLLSNVRLLITGTLTVTHATLTSYVPAVGGPMSLIRNLLVSANNGFNPYQVSGVGMFLLNQLNEVGSITAPLFDTVANVNASRMPNKLGNVAAVGGTANPFQQIVNIPLSLNDRDPVGLILAQNEETVITVQVDFDAAAAAIGTGQVGYTAVLSNLVVTPYIESFSIPTVATAFPDISTLKLVQETNQSIAGSGIQTVKLPVGNLYRKLILYVTNATGAGETDANLSGGDISILINTADNPLKYKPFLLAGMNATSYATPLPNGAYALDFSDQGWPNYSGSRDYIDTSSITEFWLQFTAAAAGNVKVIYELLSRLAA
jgi:hypothetical protein